MATKATKATKVIVEVEECIVCCEPFNKSTHACVECEYGSCKYKACVACVRAYLLTSTNEPHCMECKQVWTDKFTLVLKKTWLTNTYKPHIQNLKVDIELSRLAESMPLAEHEKSLRNEQKKKEEIDIQIKKEYDLVIASKKPYEDVKDEYKTQVKKTLEEIIHPKLFSTSITKFTWLHGNVNNNNGIIEYNMRQMKCQDGEFIVSLKSATECVLYMMFRNQLTQHLITKKEDGYIYVNDTKFRIHFISGLIGLLKMPREDWPCQLTKVAYPLFRNYYHGQSSSNIHREWLSFISNHETMKEMNEKISVIERTYHKKMTETLYNERSIIITNLYRIKRQGRLVWRGGDQANVAEEEEKKVFFMPCPATDCRGMLSTQYKCGICDLYTCKECHELIKNDEDGHTCDPNNVESAAAIKKETKQCPGCHNRIYRSEGCTQMWCTGCHTAFDWRTGKKVLSERLHNPHWQEYQRSINKGAIPRAPGDIPCGGLCGREHLEIIKSKIVDYHELVQKVSSLHRMVENINNNLLREARTRVQTLRDFEKLRVKYILGDISKEKMASMIYTSDKKRKQNAELVNVYEILSGVGVDLFNRLFSSTESDEFVVKVVEELDQYNELRLYANGLLANISNTYSMSVSQYDPLYKMTTRTFNQKWLSQMPKTLEDEKKKADENDRLRAAEAERVKTTTSTRPVPPVVMPVPIEV